MPGLSYPVTFVPAGNTVWVPEGTTVTEAARRAGILLPSPCGGRGICGKCGVRVVEGNPAPPDASEARGLKLAPPNVRLACLLRVDGPLTIKPVVTLGAIGAAAGAAGTPAGPLRAAIDLGTTTVEAVIFSAGSGKELGRAIAPNAQATYGADVLSRVAADGEGHGDRLRDAVRASAREALVAACGSAGHCLEEIDRVVVAGNSVVSASFAGRSLAGFAAHPFEAPLQDVVRLSAPEALGKDVAAEATVTVVPSVHSFVGGDLTAGLLAAGLMNVSASTLYVDIGTNAEIALARPLEFSVASAPAGPAFEGAGITSGGPAVDGAVRTVTLTGSGLTLECIGGGSPRWLTGSGLVSAVDALVAAGHIDEDGRMVAAGPFASRASKLGDVLAIRLTEDDSDEPLWVSQTDVRALQMAKSAIAAAVETVLRNSGARVAGIERVIVAGAFGGGLAVGAMERLGMLPERLTSRVEPVGNASLTGAAMMALDESLIDESVEALANARHIELAMDSAFSERYMAHLPLRPFAME